MRIFHILAFASLLLLSACGQKGPLYHPQPEPSAAESAETDEEKTEESESDS